MSFNSKTKKKDKGLTSMLAETSRKFAKEVQKQPPELNIILVNGRVKEPKTEGNVQDLGSIINDLQIRRNAKIMQSHSGSKMSNMTS